MNSAPNGGNLRSRVIANLRLPDYCMVTELKDDYNQKLRLNPNCTNWRTFARGYDGDWMTWRSLKLPLKRLRSKAAGQPQEEPQEHTFLAKIQSPKKGGNAKISRFANLREIHFGDFRSTKIAIFSGSVTLSNVNLKNFSLQRVQEFSKIKSHSL